MDLNPTDEELKQMTWQERGRLIDAQCAEIRKLREQGFFEEETLEEGEEPTVYHSGPLAWINKTMHVNKKNKKEE